jgi:hypothetical protein
VVIGGLRAALGRSVQAGRNLRAEGVPAGPAPLAPLVLAHRAARRLGRLPDGPEDGGELLILIGVPRSGTTVLHRSLVELGLGAGLRLAELLLPWPAALTALQPLGPALRRLDPSRHHPKEAHATGLDQIETEDAALLAAHLDGPLAAAFFDLQLDLDGLRARTARDLATLRPLWEGARRRSGLPRVISRMSSAGPRLPELARALPRARFLLTERDPAAAVLSTVSLVLSVLEARHGPGPPGLRARRVARLLPAIEGLHRATAAGAAAAPPGRLLRVPSGALTADFAGVITQIERFLGEPPDPARQAAAAAFAEAQARFRSPHKADPEALGVDIAALRARLADLGPTSPPAGPRGPQSPAPPRG